MPKESKSLAQEFNAHDREQINGLKASLLEILDGDSILQYTNLKAFQDWLDVVLAYEEETDNDQSAHYLEQAYAELTTEAKAGLQSEHC